MAGMLLTLVFGDFGQDLTVSRDMMLHLQNNQAFRDMDVVIVTSVQRNRIPLNNPYRRSLSENQLLLGYTRA
jgi:hypothetical protein